MRHYIISKSLIRCKNSDNGHGHFVNSTREIGEPLSNPSHLFINKYHQDGMDGVLMETGERFSLDFMVYHICLWLYL